MFDKTERSSFKYWFAHWCSFNMVALNQKCWKFKYLFHDIEKPFLKLILPYKTLQKFHRFHNKHHPEYYFLQMGKYHKCDNYDYEATIIDWECSHYTKTNCPRNAKQEIDAQYLIYKNNESKYVKQIVEKYSDYFNEIIDENGNSRYIILVEKFYQNLYEKLKKMGLN